MKDSKELFIVPPQNSFFEALLHGKSRCSTSTPSSSTNIVPLPFPGRPAVLLPKKLFLQLDNSAKDNKNQCHGFLLIADCKEGLQGSNNWVSYSRPHSRGHRCVLQLPIEPIEDEEYVRLCRSYEGIHGLLEDNCIYS